MGGVLSTVETGFRRLTQNSVAKGLDEIDYFLVTIIIVPVATLIGKTPQHDITTMEGSRNEDESWRFTAITPRLFITKLISDAGFTRFYGNVATHVSQPYAGTIATIVGIARFSARGFRVIITVWVIHLRQADDRLELTKRRENGTNVYCFRTNRGTF